MSIILYGGTKEAVQKQLACEPHDWHGPGIDRISRYFKCLKCFAIDRDLQTEAQYFEAVTNSKEEAGKKRRKGKKS